LVLQVYASGEKLPAVNRLMKRNIIGFSGEWSVQPAILFKRKTAAGFFPAAVA
jgi:hypothetical protein